MSEEIQVHLTEGDKESLINWYVFDHLQPESQEVFVEACHEYQFDDDRHYERALADAIVNEMANTILKEAVEHEETKFLLFGER